jgi:acyl dehydratase
MEMTSESVGAELRPHEVELSHRQIMNYAAGVGDLNPLYFDDTAPDGSLAPPMLVASLTWQITRRFPEFMDRDPFPREWLGYGVHYTEAVEYHRPMRPGDRMIIRGKLVAALPHRSGTYVVLRYQGADLRGEPVFTEHFGWLYRGVVCQDPGRGAGELPGPMEAPEYSESLWEATLPIPREFAHMYDGCADIHNPIHTSRRFALSVGLPEPILHGTATLALAMRELVNREAGGDPLRLKTLSCRFTGMVLLGSTIRVQLLARRDGRSSQKLFFQVLTPSGQKAIRKGYAQLALP